VPSLNRWYKALRLFDNMTLGALNCASVIHVGITGNLVRYARFLHAVTGSG
jgi:hypothetical protein